LKQKGIQQQQHIYYWPFFKSEIKKVPALSGDQFSSLRRQPTSSTFLLLLIKPRNSKCRVQTVNNTFALTNKRKERKAKPGKND
jgi:hypothetical protein